LHELLRREDIQGVFPQQADGKLDIVLRRPQGAAAILPACQGDHGHQTCERGHHEYARRTHPLTFACFDQIAAALLACGEVFRYIEPAVGGPDNVNRCSC
jgi:hypothetical protein